MKGNQKIGTLDIRIFWHNTESFSKKSHESQAVNEVHELHAKINEYIKVHRYDP